MTKEQLTKEAERLWESRLDPGCGWVKDSGCDSLCFVPVGDDFIRVIGDALFAAYEAGKR